MAVVVAAVIAIAMVSAATVWFSIEARPPHDDIGLAIRCFHGFDLFLVLTAIVLGAAGRVNLLDSRVDLALFLLITAGAGLQVYEQRRRRSVSTSPPPG